MPKSTYEKFKVLGYVRPAEVFHTLLEWEKIVLELIDLQSGGLDTRAGEISCKHASFCSAADFDRFVEMINVYFGYQLNVETERYDLLTQKNVLDFIEDFVNHRFWGFEQEFSSYFPDISRLKFAYFYSRGDMEPYVMLDEEYTDQFYGSEPVVKPVCHFTSPKGLERLNTAIQNGEAFDISTYTVAERPFFRKESTVTVEMIGHVRAAFRSDIKALALGNTSPALKKKNQYLLK